MTDQTVNLPLGAQIDVRALAKGGSSYHLTLPHSLFTRLNEACQQVLSDVSLEVQFYQDLQGLNTLEGDLSVQVELICERCLQPFALTLASHFKSTPDAAKVRSLRLEDKADVLDLNAEGLLDFYAYLEDCLLLELPFVPRHADEKDCAVKGESWSFGREDIAAASPFAALKGLGGAEKP